MAALFKQMTVCGVGLIGGSLALIAKREGLIERVVGLGRTQKNLDVALKRGIIDEATRDPAAAARGADLVMLAVPVRTMPETLAAMVPHLPPAAVITDVGSVKGWVVAALEPLLGTKMALVGVHPVAGKETTGAGAADESLFVGRRAIITPSARSTPDAIDRVERLWRATGSRVERMAPGEHDEILARASHLPQMVASALAAALNGARVDGREAAAYGAGGLRDTTRIAASSAEMWRDIVLTNRDAIIEALGLFRGVLEELERAIASGDVARFEEIFNRGRAMREALK
ncbi:MAG TPA: prephenate dehydrogenase/arogenate dehydrogenase family protein [Candidatus Binataceae bacterium]|nr:prephenate dehydrogenase/arogenate dehydrogenase family protein [Candidatus Binataceae bacterium]